MSIRVLSLGDVLLVSIQIDLEDRLAVQLQEDLADRIVDTGVHGVLIDITALDIVDSFVGRMLATIAAMSRVLDAETVVVGMRPAVAITLVELGLPLTGIRTALNVELGLAALRVRDTSTYGAPMRQTFFKAGEVIIELIGPEEPATDGSADGPAGFFGLVLTVADLDAAADLLGAGLGTPKDAVQPGRRIATMRHRDLGLSVAIALMSPEPGAVSTG